MQRYIGLDAHSSSCTLGVVGPGGKRLGYLVSFGCANGRQWCACRAMVRGLRANFAVPFSEVLRRWVGT